jgi:hypothetical protein
MWRDLYRFFDKATSTKPNTPEWEDLGAESHRIWDKYNRAWFVREVLALTLSYAIQQKLKGGEKDG